MIHSTHRRHDPSTRLSTVVRRTGKAVLIILGGIVFAMMLLFVILNIETSPPSAKPSGSGSDFSQVKDLIPTIGLDGQSPLSSVESVASELAVDLPSGGWIQSTDEQNRLKQQYRFAKATPLPNGWIDMQRPLAEFYFGEDRVVTLEGDRAHAHAPHRALSEGRIEGRVIVRMYEHVSQRPFDAANHLPSLEVRTERAEFDNLSGEILCEGAVDVQTPQVHVPGEYLRILVNDQAGRVERMTMRRVGTIRLIGTESGLVAERRDEVKQGDVVLASMLQDRDERRGRNPTRRRTEGRQGVSNEDPQFYVLTLHERVRIVEGDDSTGRRAEGDLLRVVFALQSMDDRPAPVRTALSRVEMDSGACCEHQRSMYETLMALLIGTTQSPPGLFNPGPEDIITVITCTGGMAMEPASDTTDVLASKGDMRIDLIGEPVRMFDPREQFYGECGKAVMHRPREKFELIASPASPVLIDSPQLAALAQHFFHDKSSSAGGFVGPGWLRPRDRVESEATSVTILADSSSKTQDEANQAVSTPPAGFVKKADPVERLHIEWTESAKFSIVESKDRQQKPSLKHIAFAGKVLVESKGDDPGVITCEQLQLALLPDSNGKSVPQSMIADGDVKTKDRQMTLWSDWLHVTFRQSPPEGGGVTSAESPSATNSIIGRDTDINTVHATGDVQVLLSDGSRVFCDELDGASVDQTLVLTGDDVVVVSDTMMMSRGTTIRIARSADQTEVVSDGGQMSFFEAPFDVTTDRRIARPGTHTPLSDPELRVRWEDSMQMNMGGESDSAVVTFTGQVTAVSTPSPQQQDLMLGQSLRLEFVETEPTSEASSRAVTSPSLSKSNDAQQIRGNRRLARLIATGNSTAPAKMESRVWEPNQLIDDGGVQSPDPSAKPRVYYLEGPAIDYQNITGDARVHGAGTLLTRDLRPSTDAGRSEVSPFSSRGTTMFSWKDSLEMKRTFDDRSEIVMLGGVEVVHRHLTGQPSTFSGDELRSTVLTQPVTKNPPPAGAPGTPTATVNSSANLHIRPANALAFGGAMELVRLEGRGNLLINTPSREIMCDLFDYNEATRVADIRALAGRSVSIKTRGSASPVQAGRVLWDIARDTISIERLGSGK